MVYKKDKNYQKHSQCGYLTQADVIIGLHWLKTNFQLLNIAGNAN